MNYMLFTLTLLMLAACALHAQPALGVGVTLVESKDKKFLVRTGGFEFSYDGSKDDHITARNPKPGGGWIEVIGAPGENLYPLEHSIVRSVETTETAADILVRIDSAREWADFKTTVRFPKNVPGLVNWKVELSAKSKGFLPTTDFDVLFGDYPVQFKDLGRHNPAQVPLVYFYEGKLDATCLFYEDYTALNQYYIMTDTRPAGAVGANLPIKTRHTEKPSEQTRAGFGYKRPSSDHILPPQSQCTITDSYCFLKSSEPADESAMCGQFLECLADIYPYMLKPATVYTDWPTIAGYQIRDLQSPECWTREFNGRRHLLPYVNHKDSGANDLRTELQNLAPLVTFNRSFANEISRKFEEQLVGNIKDFHVPQTGMIENMITKPGDKSVQDSFYPAINAIMFGKVILRGVDDPQLKRMLLEFADVTMKTGRKLNYTFAWQVDWLSGEIVNESFWQYDVGGALAYFFLQCHQISGDKKYLDEAKVAVESIKGHGLALPHELDCTAAAAAACAWLYNITGDKHYLDLGAIAVANVMRRGWFWQSEYGYAKYYRMFFGLSFSKEGPQIAPLELLGCWDMLSEYYRRLSGVLPAEYHVLLPEFHKWVLTDMRYVYPPLVPEDAVAPGPAGWPVNPRLYVALEDMNDGHTRLGTVGQGIYMSRAAIEFAASAYRRFENGPILFCEYPIMSASYDSQLDMLRFTVGGLNNYRCKVRVLYPQKLNDDVRPFLATNALPAMLLEGSSHEGQTLCFEAPGGAEVVAGPGRLLRLQALISNLKLLAQSAAADATIKKELFDSEDLLSRTMTLTSDPRKEFHEWLAAFDKLSIRLREMDGRESVTECLSAMRDLAAEESQRLLGIRFDLKINKTEWAEGEPVKAVAALDVSPGVQLEKADISLKTPVRFRVTRDGNSFQVFFPDDYPFNKPAQIEARMSCEYMGAPVVLRRTCDVKRVAAFTFLIASTSGDFATQGKNYDIQVKVTNNASVRRDAELKLKLPKDWTSSCGLSRLVLNAGEARDVTLSLTPGAAVPDGKCEIELVLIAGGAPVASRCCVVEAVAVHGAFRDDGRDASLWKESRYGPPVPVESKDGRLVFGPRDGGFGVREREVCIDLDHYPILSIKMDAASALWAIFLDDGRHFPELGLRVQQETWQTGVFHYDLRKSTGWKGINKFNLRFVTSIWGKDRTCILDWITIDKDAVTTEPVVGDQ
ncbi:MAG: hypothetical protein WCK47_08250 [bacterium]